MGDSAVTWPRRRKASLSSTSTFEWRRDSFFFSGTHQSVRGRECRISRVLSHADFARTLLSLSRLFRRRARGSLSLRLPRGNSTLNCYSPHFWKRLGVRTYRLQDVAKSMRCKSNSSVTAFVRWSAAILSYSKQQVAIYNFVACALKPLLESSRSYDDQLNVAS